MINNQPLIHRYRMWGRQAWQVLDFNEAYLLSQIPVYRLPSPLDAARRLAGMSDITRGGK